MGERIEVDLDEVRRVFQFLGNANELMHNNMRYRDVNMVERFVCENYPLLRELYYHVVWNWLPPHVQEEIMEE
jgi:hypothetical protein